MSEKRFPTLVVVSTITGTALCDMPGYGTILECASHLFGADVYLHEIIHEPTRDAYCEEAYLQFPDLPSRAEVKANLTAAAAKALAAYGDTILVRQGSHGRRESPIATAKAVAPHVTVIGIDLGREGGVL